MTHTRTIVLPFLAYKLFPFDYFHHCTLHKSATFRDIFFQLYENEYLVKTIRHIQERVLHLFQCQGYAPLVIVKKGIVHTIAQ